MTSSAAERRQDVAMCVSPWKTFARRSRFPERTLTTTCRQNWAMNPATRFSESKSGSIMPDESGYKKSNIKFQKQRRQMGLFTGKKGIVLGVANDRSIAWSIAEHLHREGAEIGFTHLPDTGDRPKNQNKVAKLVDPIGSKFLMPMDVCNDEHIAAVIEKAVATFGKIDFIVHSIAFAPPADLTGPTYACSRNGFKSAMEISAYSLLAVAGAAKKQDALSPDCSILTLSYFGGEEVIPGYNLMGICKAALECCVRYLASELGPTGTRVNAISAGPLRTVSSSGVGDFDKMQIVNATIAPLRRNLDVDEVGSMGMVMLSKLSSGMTGEVVHVDCGFNIMGAPPADFLTRIAAGT